MRSTRGLRRYLGSRMGLPDSRGEGAGMAIGRERIATLVPPGRVSEWGGGHILFPGEEDSSFRLVDPGTCLPILARTFSGSADALGAPRTFQNGNGRSPSFQPHSQSLTVASGRSPRRIPAGGLALVSPSNTPNPECRPAMIPRALPARISPATVRRRRAQSPNVPGAEWVGEQREVGKAAGAGLQFGLTICIFAVAGLWLDGRFGTDPWLLVTGVLLSFFGGTVSLIKKVQLIALRSPSTRPQVRRS